MIEDLGLLAARLALGLGMASHGAQKAFGWFDGPGPSGVAAFMDNLGFKPAERYAAAVTGNELGGGLLIALGLGGPIGPAAVIANMLVAQTTVHAKNGWFAGKNGVELGTVYAAGALALASKGYGTLSLDAALGLERKLHHPVVKTLVIAGALAAGWAVLGSRDLGPPSGTLATPTIRGGQRNGEPAPAPAS